MANESKAASAQYILGFYQQVDSLTTWQCQYMGLLIELEKQYGTSDISKLEDAHKNALMQFVQSLRHQVNKSYIQFSSMALILKDLDPELKTKIDASYRVLATQFILDRVASQEYTILMNSVIVQNVVRELLVTSQDILNQMYAQPSQHQNG